MRSLSGLAIAVVLAASLPGCKSAGGPKPQAPAAPLPEALQSWNGQRRLLAGAGEATSLALKAADPLPKGDCDVAVALRSTSFDKGTLSVTLDTLGRAEVSGRMRGRECREVPASRRLTVSGLAATDAALAALERLLTTPEAHLAARDVAFDLAPETRAPGPVASEPTGSDGTSEERSLGRQVGEWPKLLLAVHPLVSGRVRHEGEIEFAATVGVDGRLYKPALVTDLAEAQAQKVLEVFGLWRYEPAKKGQDRVAARVRGRTTLRIR